MLRDSYLHLRFLLCVILSAHCRRYQEGQVQHVYKFKNKRNIVVARDDTEPPRLKYTSLPLILPKSGN